MDIDISGARIFFTFPFDFPILGKLSISETMLVSWIVMAVITLLCIFLTRDLKVENISKRQALAELIVETADHFVVGNMGERFRYMIPFVAALFATSVVSNLISLIGLRSPTADLSTEAAWAVVVFILITSEKIKAGGIGGYLKGFTQPIPVLTPFNILSELATPISMACRHFGNILSGVVIDTLIYGALAVASSALFGLLPGALGNVLSKVPFLSVGLPAITGVYFDWFSGCMQAFIFSMLTVMYIANAAES
ncbi:MAG: F0F1 ATP synthase subunit A [Blautia sp.]|nr:F0F1 ATP synthase subunit A [Blautia sp.]